MADVELHIGRFLILLVGILCLSSAEVQGEREVRYSALILLFLCLKCQKYKFRLKLRKCSVE